MDATLETGSFDISLTSKTIGANVSGDFTELMVYIYDESNKVVVFPKQLVTINNDNRTSGNPIVMNIPELKANTSYFIQISPINGMIEGKAISSRFTSESVDSTVDVLSEGTLTDASSDWTEAILTLSDVTGAVEWKATLRNGTTTVNSDFGFSDTPTVDTGFTLVEEDYIIIAVRLVDSEEKPTSTWKIFTSKSVQ